jgi:hypothetical protein
MWADYQGEICAGAGRGAGGSPAGGEDAGDGSEILGWNVQDGSPCCGLAPQRKSASRLFRCRVAAGECESPSAVNIRKEFEKCKPRR